MVAVNSAYVFRTNLDPVLSHIGVPLLILNMRRDGTFTKEGYITQLSQYRDSTHDKGNKSDAPSGE